MPCINGKENVVDSLKGVMEMDTTHMLSNFRVCLNESADGGGGRSARVTCYALSNHFKAGEGPSPVSGAGFMVGNRYEVDLVGDGQQGWKIKKVVINLVWSKGDLSIFGR